MREILAAIADEVAAETSGVRVSSHDGFVDDVIDDDTVAVIVPHEYAAVSPELSPAAASRTIAFGVEHPGTETFKVSSAYAARLGGWFEIGASSIAALPNQRPRHFPLGYVRKWDMWGGSDADRPIDVTYLGTADPRRLSILAQAAPALAPFRTSLLMPPHEPMVRPRPDFLMGQDKWQHLSQSKILINLHRDEKTAFEWVRALEAMINGCVVVTEPSSDLGPLEPGRHLLVSPREHIGQVVAGALADDERLTEIASAAYDLCRETLNMAPYARELAEVATQLASRRTAPPREQESSIASQPSWASAGEDPPMAVWVPTLPSPPVVPPIRTPTVTLDPRLSSTSATPGTVALVCAVLPHDGPLAETMRSFPSTDGSAALTWVHPLDESVPAHRGRVRNQLLREVAADYVLVLDGGDSLRGDALARMTSMLDADPAIDAVICPATHGSDALVNSLAPELRRLEARPYLSRGFVVRTATLRALGGFTEDDGLEDLVDHHFWLSLARAGGNATLMPHIGIALWPRNPAW